MNRPILLIQGCWLTSTLAQTQGRVAILGKVVSARSPLSLGALEGPFAG
jgi:hypothetical protein